MSAFICTDTHINALVTWASANKVTVTDGNLYKIRDVYNNELSISELFYIANVISVNYRYKLADPIGDIVYKPTGLYRPVEIIKLCNSLDYQSCEHPDWDDSLAKKLLDEIRQKAITKLPGYDAAPWSI